MLKLVGCIRVRRMSEQMQAVSEQRKLYITRYAAVLAHAYRKRCFSREHMLRVRYNAAARMSISDDSGILILECAGDEQLPCRYVVSVTDGSLARSGIYIFDNALPGGYHIRRHTIVYFSVAICRLCVAQLRRRSFYVDAHPADQRIFGKIRRADLEQIERRYKRTLGTSERSNAVEQRLLKLRIPLLTVARRDIERPYKAREHGGKQASENRARRYTGSM